MKSCKACPFNDGLTEEATIAQNYGCLPTAHDMIETLENRDIAISCHDHDHLACRGLASCRDVRGKKVWSYAKWYRGEEA